MKTTMKTTVETKNEMNLEAALLALTEETIAGQTYAQRSRELAQARVLSDEAMEYIRHIGSRKVHTAQCYCDWCDRHDEALDITPSVEIQILA